MGVYIRGMEMPTTCCNCDFMAFNPEILWEDAMGEQRGAYVCKRTGELIDNTKREDHCPLIEIQPHGRLIDADAAYEQFLNLMDIQGAINPCQLGTILVDAPTIIEADCPPSTPLEQVWTELFGEDGE